jgi:nucleotide-binding universal stress UspA family protein
MFRNVIVGVDGRQGGQDALALAKHLSDTDGSLTAARVLIRDRLTGRGGRPELEAAERARTHALQDAARDEPRSDSELRTVFAPSVGRGLHELADAQRADLLVVGSCHRGLVGRVMVGDDTSDALNGAPCALAIAPVGYAERPARWAEIGVAYNGSSESEDALAAARSLVAAHGAKLSAFEAVSVPAYLSIPGAGAAGEALPGLVRQARERIEALGGVQPHAAYGVAAEELAMYSASLDLLVVGSRAYGPVGRFMHGSTSRQLARTARCPVLVLTRAARVMLSLDQNHAPEASAVGSAGAA